MAIKIVGFLLALALVVNGELKCSEIKSDTNKQHVKMLEDNSLKTYIYISNDPEHESCLSLGYHTLNPQPQIVEDQDVNRHSVAGVAIMHNIMIDPYIVSIVNITTLKDDGGWKVWGGMPSPVNFRVVLFDISEPYLCALTCDSDDKIMNFRCIVNNEAGLKKLLAALKPLIKDWPFNGKLPRIVFGDECRITGTNVAKNL